VRSQCSIASATLRGVEALPVTVEVAVSNGMPGMAIVGMPDTAVQEARERVRAAISAAGFTMPTNKIVVNLAPADLRKTGSGLDLPIALGILVATGQVPASLAEGRLFAGELSLEGAVRPVRGLLAFGICAHGQGLALVTAPEGSAVPLRELVAAPFDGDSFLAHCEEGLPRRSLKGCLLPGRSSRSANGSPQET